MRRFRIADCGFGIGLTRKCIVALALGILAGPLAAAAQPPAKVPRIGFLGAGSPSTYGPLIVAFRQGLRDLGYVEGQNVVMELRWAEGRLERLPDLAAELVSLKVDVIVGGGTLGALAAKNATSTIPIVMPTAADAVGSGLVARGR